jgi:hypothetical protein
VLVASAAADQHGETVTQPFRDVLDRESPDARRGQFQRERDAVEPTADFHDRVRIPIRQLEVRPHCMSSIEEELDGRDL